jgi:hypothetical protein
MSTLFFIMRYTVFSEKVATCLSQGLLRNA